MHKLNKTEAQQILNRMVKNWFVVDGQRQKVTSVSIAPHTHRVMVMSNLSTNFAALAELPQLLLRYQAVDADLAAYMRAALGVKTEAGPYHPHIAARIRQIRLRRGIKQGAVASALGCTQQNNKSIMPVLDCVKISIGKKKAELTVTNLSITIATTIKVETAPTATCWYLTKS